MQKRIFLKYFTICAGIIVSILFVMGVLCSAVLAEQAIGETSKNLESAAGKIASMYGWLPKNGTLLGNRALDNAVDVVRDTLDAEVIIATDSGLIAKSTVPGLPHTFAGATGADEALETVLSGKEYRARGGFAGIRRAYTVGVPIMTDDNRIEGAVFVTTGSIDLFRTLLPFLLFYSAFTGLALVIAFIFIYFVTLRLFSPLTQMRQAARAYADGDFSMRVAVKHNDELGELASAFNNMADSLDRLEQMRRGFVEDVSHELRTPMTTIAGFIDGILDGVIEPEDEKRCLGIVSDEIKRLSRMVSGMLDVAKIQSGTMVYAKVNFDLCEIMGKILAGFAERINDKAAQIVCPIDPGEEWFVYGDPDAVYRVVYNLLDNALKFVNHGGTVSLDMRRENGMIRTAVRNTGDGIPKAEAEHIFERFYKTDKSRSKNKNGVGIGLYLVGNIVKDLGGEVQVDSVVGEYAEFVFTLPAAREI